MRPPPYPLSYSGTHCVPSLRQSPSRPMVTMQVRQALFLTRLNTNSHFLNGPPGQNQLSGESPRAYIWLQASSQDSFPPPGKPQSLRTPADNFRRLERSTKTCVRATPAFYRYWENWSPHGPMVQTRLRSYRLHRSIRSGGAAHVRVSAHPLSALNAVTLVDCRSPNTRTCLGLCSPAEVVLSGAGKVGACRRQTELLASPSPASATPTQRQENLLQLSLLPLV